jgi:rubrerythrin
MTAMIDTARPDEPVPYTLTAKAVAYLDRMTRAAGTAVIDGALSLETALAGAAIPDCLGEWACRRCGFAFFGTPADDELCPDCRDDS